MAEVSERSKRLIREFWAAILFFLTGVLFVLLAAGGKVFLGEAFDGGILQYPGYGLILVAVYVLVGVNLPRLIQGKSDVSRREDTDANEAKAPSKTD